MSEAPVVTEGGSMVAGESEARTGSGPKLASPHLPFVSLPRLMLLCQKYVFSPLSLVIVHLLEESR